MEETKSFGNLKLSAAPPRRDGESSPVRNSVNFLCCEPTPSCPKAGIRRDQGRTGNTAACRFKPFNNLKSLLEKKALQPAPGITLRKKPPGSGKGSFRERVEDENRLFMEAMADVTPIARNKNTANYKKQAAPNLSEHSETEMLRYLDELIKYGSNFVVSLTPEYIEGTACNVPVEIAKKLHQGDFSIQNHIDLHGYVSSDAYNTLDVFLKKSVLNGVRAVLIIHGRGLSSAGDPVLKNNIIKWLTSGKWKKWVLAFTSARHCDGGAGGTYVLLRNHPVPKRLRKKKLVRNNEP